MESPLHRYLADIHYALKAGAFYSALALSVPIPDIYGGIEYPDEKSVGKRYRDWFDQWCAMLQSYLDAADCYAIRCSYLHQGIDEFWRPERGSGETDTHRIYRRHDRWWLVIELCPKRARARGEGCRAHPG